MENGPQSLAPQGRGHNRGAVRASQEARRRVAQSTPDLPVRRNAFNPATGGFLPAPRALRALSKASMSYLVLARKWRPKRFAELVGQEHVVRALTNALASGRVHHAFLFTGTRGVGKTTIARIFAKSLNCEQGTSADPCGECNSCRDIDAGRYMDLLEIDAASNTGVDDVRELIDNAQYMPSRGRVKVYLIDEVHMLSKAAFNALLKTLEEPPGHVKFLLATTDPQKLPVTVLSRCLQFNLKRLDEAQIAGQIARILEAEAIAVEAGAIRQLSRAADGSLRDGLSLLDQAIAYAGAGGDVVLGDDAVATMLGSVDRARVGAMLAALATGDGTGLLDEIATLAEFSPDWASVLDALAEALHRVQVRQLVPGVEVDADGVDLDALATAIPAELVQLWYQMALHGRRDLPLAPSARAGFEMAVLRMLAFRPDDSGGSHAAVPAKRSADAVASARAALAKTPVARDAVPPPVIAPRIDPITSPRAVAPPAPREPPTSTPVSKQSPIPVPMPVMEASAPQRELVESPASAVAEAAPETPWQSDSVVPAMASPDVVEAAVGLPDASPSTPHVARIADADAWADAVAASGLKGPAKVLAEHSVFIAHNADALQLAIADTDAHLRAPGLIAMLAKALAPRLGGVPEIRFEAAVAGSESLRDRNDRAKDMRQSAAEHAFLNDPHVQRLMQAGATVVPASIRPLDDV